MTKPLMSLLGVPIPPAKGKGAVMGGVGRDSQMPCVTLMAASCPQNHQANLVLGALGQL